MHFYAKVVHILKILEIPQPVKFASVLLAGMHREKYIKALKSYNPSKEQNGGAEKYKIVNYHNVDFKFLIYETDGLLTYALHIMNDPDKLPECIVVIIHKEEHMVQIEGVSQHMMCYTKEQLDKLNKMKIKVSGELLMRLALKLITEIKDKYGIKYIVLQDNSHKICKNVNLELGLMYTLLNGITWYGKFGFAPANTNNNAVNESYLGIYKKNKQIMDSILVKDVGDLLVKYISEFDKKINAKQMIKDKGELKLAHFLKLLLKTNNGCALFESFYIKLAVKIGIYNFFGKNFILVFKK